MANVQSCDEQVGAACSRCCHCRLCASAVLFGRRCIFYWIPPRVCHSTTTHHITERCCVTCHCTRCKRCLLLLPLPILAYPHGSCSSGACLVLLESMNTRERTLFAPSSLGSVALALPPPPLTTPTLSQTPRKHARYAVLDARVWSVFDLARPVDWSSKRWLCCCECGAMCAVPCLLQQDNL